MLINFVRFMPNLVIMREMNELMNATGASQRASPARIMLTFLPMNELFALNLGLTCLLKCWK